MPDRDNNVEDDDNDGDNDDDDDDGDDDKCRWGVICLQFWQNKAFVSLVTDKAFVSGDIHKQKPNSTI